jgi:hypothetical protein
MKSGKESLHGVVASFVTGKWRDGDEKKSIQAELHLSHLHDYAERIIFKKNHPP